MIKKGNGDFSDFQDVAQNGQAGGFAGQQNMQNPQNQQNMQNPQNMQRQPAQGQQMQGFEGQQGFVGQQGYPNQQTAQPQQRPQNQGFAGQQQAQRPPQNSGWVTNAPQQSVYDQKSQSGALYAQGQQVIKGYTNPGQTLGQQTQQPQQPRPQMQMQNQQTMPQGGLPQGMMNNQPMMDSLVPPQTPDNGGQPVPEGGKKKNGGKKKLIIVVAVILVFLIVCLVIRGIKTSKEAKKEAEEAAQSAAEVNYSTSGRYAYDTLLNALISYTPEDIDAAVGTETGDSYLAQEWAYVNKVPLREEFLKKVGANLKFTYPTDEAGNQSAMMNGEAVTVTIPDWATLTETMDEEQQLITGLYATYLDTRANPYDESDQMFNLLMQYLCDKKQLPETTVDVVLEARLSEAGVPYIADDAPLDDALFGSQEFRDMCAKFSQICVGWTGYKDEKYTEKEEVENEEYARWFELFLSYYEADGGSYDPATGELFGGVFRPGRSKWEPWYLRDENNNIVLDENGEKIVNYYSCKDEDGNDWIQPDKIILVDVEKTRQVEDPWVEETGIYYNCLGTHWITTEYAGLGTKLFRVGDGTVKYPAGIGTPIITKCLGVDGVYHDVEVAMQGYWVGEDAIDYAESFSSRNRGFTTSSVVQLICFEFTIKNLENVTVTLNSELTLCDKNANISSRTGTMYGFSNENITIKAGETVRINDWASSTELQQKYAGWGKTFGRQYDMVYFDCLAGTGVIPSYSAYEQFVGSDPKTEE